MMILMKNIIFLVDLVGPRWSTKVSAHVYPQDFMVWEYILMQRHNILPTIDVT